MPSQTRRFTSFIDSGEGGTLALVNPSNVGASDNQYMTASTSASGFPLSRFLHCTIADPPFSIPLGATNITLDLAVEGHASDLNLVSYLASMLLDGVREVDLATAGYFSTSDSVLTSPFPTSDVRITPAKLNDPANGVAFQFQFGGMSGLDGLSTVIGLLDDMTLTVNYDLPSTTNSNILGKLTAGPQCLGKLTIEPRTKGTVKVE